MAKFLTGSQGKSLVHSPVFGHRTRLALHTGESHTITPLDIWSKVLFVDHVSYTKTAAYFFSIAKEMAKCFHLFWGVGHNCKSQVMIHLDVRSVCVEGVSCVAATCWEADCDGALQASHPRQKHTHTRPFTHAPHATPRSSWSP